MSAGRILIVDDEPQIRRVLRTSLIGAGYETVDVRSGEEAVLRLREDPFDLILLDMNMQGMGGLQACREIRDVSAVPIVMLTVRNEEKDKVQALDAGADDFVSKPFGMPELLARIRAHLRRSVAATGAGVAEVSFGDVHIDFKSRRLTVKGNEVRLTPKEFELLRYLATHPNQAISHRELLQAVWGPDYGNQVEYLRVFIKQLRRKVEPTPEKPDFILTEPWIGYRFRLPEDPKSL
jgi:two-component system, OmpR family, KDP operon response regulator KdpE